MSPLEIWNQKSAPFSATDWSGPMAYLSLVGKTHRPSGFSSEIDADAQEVSGAGSFATFATHAVLGARRRGNLASFAAIPRHHFQHVQRASANALGATNASVIDFDSVRHRIYAPKYFSTIF